MVIWILADWRYRKIIFGGTSVWAPILFEQFQNSTGFNTQHENTCPFSSHIGSYIPTFRGMYFNLTAWKKNYDILYKIYHIYICIHIQMHTYIYIYKKIHIYIYIYIYIYIFLYIYFYIYIYIYIHSDKPIKTVVIAMQIRR